MSIKLQCKKLLEYSLKQQNCTHSGTKFKLIIFFNIFVKCLQRSNDSAGALDRRQELPGNALPRTSSVSAVAIYNFINFLF